MAIVKFLKRGEVLHHLRVFLFLTCMRARAVHVRRFPHDWEQAWVVACSVTLLQLLLLHQVALALAASRA
jgi:hypothetical protein